MTNTTLPKSKAAALLNHVKEYYLLYLLLIPGLLHMYFFKYRPMSGLLIAFQDYRVTRGIAGSEWLGLENLRNLFTSISFTRVLVNSLLNSFLLLICAFPAPILLALMLNEVRSIHFKKVLQTVLYLPHFVSWVVVAGLVTSLLGTSTGSIINDLVVRIGGQKIQFLTDPKYYRLVLIGTSIWKSAGWGTVVYLAALAGIDPALYEAAVIDGANRFQKIRYITMPCILSTMIVMLILNMGNLMSNNFEQTWLLQNNLNKSVSEVLETYSYQVGLREYRFSYSAAVGMFQSVVGCTLLLSSNYAAKKLGGGGLW